MTTPAQAYGHPNFVTDVPVQGPTDEGLRSADCYHVQNQLPARPACADCKGPIPMWAQQGSVSGLGEQISFGGVGALGFAIGTVNDPEVWTKLSPDQQMWVSNTLNALNNLIVKQSGTSCPTWGPAINLASGCFQIWWNANRAAVSGGMTLRGDGVFDNDTLCALIMVAHLDSSNFPAPFPDPNKQYCQGPAPVTATAAKKKLSTAEMVGIGTAGAAVLGGIAYALSTKKRRR